MNKTELLDALDPYKVKCTFCGELIKKTESHRNSSYNSYVCLDFVKCSQQYLVNRKKSRKK